MNKRRPVAIALMSVVVGALLGAQHKRVSPHETISAVVAGGRVTVVYGRPYTKDPKTGEARKVWGGVVAFDHVWRMGADEATMLVAEKPLTVGDVAVPAGAYTLYMLPAEDGTAKLIINKQVGQWGTQYSQDMDLARVDMKKATVDAAVDQFTVDLDKDGKGGTLKATWDTASYSVALTAAK